MKYLLLAFLLLSLCAHAGRERDGGWPKSIKVLKHAKKLLIKQVSKLTELDIKTALNEMHDRNENLSPKDVNKKVLLDLISKLEIADVVELEKSKYTGARLFHYVNNYPKEVKIYATKRFYNNSRYQKKISELTLPILKEVQKLIVHEVSHIWGFGEDDPKFNYARIFASRLIMIIYGNLKKSYTNTEKIQLLNKSFQYIFTHSPYDYGENYQFISDGELSCYSINEQKTKKTQAVLKKHDYALELNAYKFSSGRLAFNNDIGLSLTALRTNKQGFVLIEHSSAPIITDSKIRSLYAKSSFPNRRLFVTKYQICHKDPKELENYEEKFIASFYTKDTGLSRFANLPLEVFKYKLQQRFDTMFEHAQADLEERILVQNQQIYNIEQVIMIQNKADYQKLISARSRYSKKRHSKIMEKFNGLLHKDIQGHHLSINNFSNVIAHMENEIKNMEDYERQFFTQEIIKSFLKDRDKLIDAHNELTTNTRNYIRPCHGKKRVGRFYQCQLEMAVARAQKLILSLKSISTSYKTQARKIKDEIEAFNY